MLSLVLFVLGFVALIKGADLLVVGASALASRFHISGLVIGLTVVAFGTSTPELFVNILASARGNTDIAIGNVLGSNIANILLILGISAIIYPLSISHGTVRKEIPFTLLAAIVLGFTANDQLIDGSGTSQLTRIDGLVFLAFFSIFLYYSFNFPRDVEGLDEQVPIQPRGLADSISRMVVGLFGLTLGAKWIIDGAVELARSFGMSESLVGLTIVAVGTSLPELATSAVAAYKKNVDLAVGNVVGSNIFNIFFVLGISSIIRPLPFQSRSNVDIAVVALSSLLLLLAMLTGKRHSLDRWEGAVLLGAYVVYIAWMVLLD